MKNISVIILTFNEELHLKRCLANVKSLTDNIFIVDSFSTDKTLLIAKEFGAHIFQNKWENNYARQFNWALINLPINTDWVLRLDADEYLTTGLIEEIDKKLPTIESEVNGITVPLRRVFMGRTIKRGGMGKIRMLRLFRFGKVKCEQRWMDEHMEVTEGKIVEFTHEFADDNLNNLNWWTAKHNGYAVREAIDLLDIELHLFGCQSRDFGSSKLSNQAGRKRKKKESYAKQPLFLRSFVYFVYRYFFKLGFLDGREGFLWHFLQGWWYRTLVDAKIYEIKKNCGTDPEKIKVFLVEKYNIRL